MNYDPYSAPYNAAYYPTFHAMYNPAYNNPAYNANYQNYGGPEFHSYNTRNAASQADAGLIQDITKAINGEYSAIRCYEVLAKMAPTTEEKNRIMEIIRDEQRHLQEFSQIYVRLTGQQPTPQQIEECPKEYKKGLETSMKDEQMTAHFYNEISRKAKDQQIHDTFHHASHDEQNHAVWFLYYFMRHCCGGK